jgi:alkaline phosphatase D
VSIRSIAPLVLTAALSGCAPAGASDRVLVTHDFDTSAQGWLVSSDTGMADPVLQPEDGNPGGYISSDDEALGETWYFRAPDTVLAQLPAAENGTLSYSLKQSPTDGGFLEDDVVIEGPAGRLSYRFATAPGTDWSDFSVALSASAGWRWNWNRPATQDQLRSVLLDPSRLEIRGEYRTGPDVGGLDSFVLTAGG